MKTKDYLIRKVAGKKVLLDGIDFYNPKILNATLQIKEGRVKLRNRKTMKTMSLAKFILKPKKGQVVDHINRNPLDNRRSNLRIVSYRQNLLNRILKNNSTGMIGVSIKRSFTKKNTPVYYAQYSDGKKMLRFRSPLTPNGLIIAAMARDKFVIQNGDEEYAPLNFPIFKQEPFRSILLKTDFNQLKLKNVG